VRIQANPTALSSYGIDLERPAHRGHQASVNAAKGNFDGPRQDYQIDANDQLVTSATTQVVVAYRNGAPVMLTDVANIVDGVENNNPGRVDEPDAGDHRERAAPARRQHHQRGQEHQALLPQLEANLPKGIRSPR
jgi:multidrug efflux pump